MSPPATAAKNRSVTSRWARWSASNRGCRACTCSRARWAICRTAASLRFSARATSATDIPNASRSTKTARSAGVSVSSTTSSASDTCSPSSAASSGSGACGAEATGAPPVRSGSGSHGPT